MSNDMNDFNRATDDWIRETTRCNRMINLDLNIPVEYTGDVALAEDRKDHYLHVGDMTQVLRELVCDNIRVEDIAAFLGLPLEGIKRIMKQMIK